MGLHNVFFTQSSSPIYSLSTAVYPSVYDLKNFRNEQFAHMPRGQLTDVEFQSAISKVQTTFSSSRSLYIADSRSQKSDKFSH